MNRSLRIATITLILIAPAAVVQADEAGAQPTGREIMELVDARDDGDHMSQDMQMILIDRNGGQRKRTMRSFGMDQGEDNWSIMFFLDPADVKDTGFLTYDYDDTDKDDDQWLYLPALKKTARCSPSGLQTTCPSFPGLLSSASTFPESTSTTRTLRFM